MGMVLTTILALSIVPSAFAGTWIYYDSGTATTNMSEAIGDYETVRFTSPCGSALILTARYYIDSSHPAAFNVHVFDSDGSTQLFAPLGVNPTSAGWFDVDLSGYNIRPSGDFYIAIEWTTANDPDLGWDGSDPDLRSYTGTPGSWVLDVDHDYMIRAEFDWQPVGGIAYSPDKLGLLSPLLMVTGIIGAIAIGSFAIKKRRI